MANISQNVNIEMLEKLPDGTYKRKYPKTRADDGTTFDEHLAESATQAHLAKNIGLEDTAGNFVATELEGAVQELFTNVSNGKNLVGGAITGVDDSVVIPTDPTFQNLADAIGNISTGKKWASGVVTPSGSSNGSRDVTVNGLDFRASVIIVIYEYVVTSSGNPYIYITTYVQDSIDRNGIYYGFASYSDTKIRYRANDASITDTGFTLRAYTSGGRNHVWYAYE